MRRARSLAIGTVAAIGLGLLSVAVLRGVAPAAEAPPTATAPVAPAPAAAATDASAPTPSPEPPPPWAHAAGTDADGTASAASPGNVREQQLAQLQATMAVMLDDALARSTASSAHLRSAIDTLEAMDDPAIKAQINLPAVRHNLDISLRMQAVARAMQAEVAQPKTPERDARIETLRGQFEALRQQLRTDVTPPGAHRPTAAVPAAGA